ncbi:CynX/NimT family MFS transporter [Luteimicrobium sp. NPDC057192]|uniref:MFS transporter n=1 Tax=Luteimicrobium sp. NPDC057192 TaxID=3346042 RepID=UPI00362E38F3
MSTPSTPRRLPAGGASGLLLTAVVLVALNLRAPIVALAPVTGDVRADLALSAAAVGVLTGLPVLCFAVASPLASAVIARLGIERVVQLALATILLGTIVRSVGSFAAAVAGTVLLGLAITAGNIAIPLVVARDFPSNAARVTGVYSAALNGGSVLATAFTAPVADAVGWQWALLVWAVLVPVAWVVWQLATRRRGPEATPRTALASAADEVHALRRPLTWLLVAMFAGQSFGYYGTTAWLPTILHDTLGLDPSASGGAASLFQLFGAIGAIAIPVVLGWRVTPRGAFVAIAVGWLLFPIGLLLAPAQWAVWASLAGAAQGANFTVIFTIVAVRATSLREARTTSTAVQTFGYVIAALAPSAMGAVHTATDGWTAPLVVLLVVVAVMVVAGLLATAPHKPDVRPVSG